MTISNTGFNPFPSSCALNGSPFSRTYGRIWGGTAFQRCSQDTPVPESVPFSFSDMMSDGTVDDGLHVPCQDQIPIGCESMVGMIPNFNGDIFQCPDGTLINTRTRKVIRDGGSSQNGMWGDGECDFMKTPDMSWNNTETNGMSQDDMEYQRYSEMKNREIENSQTDLQKQLLRDLENGRFSSQSHLIEESNRLC